MNHVHTLKGYCAVAEIAPYKFSLNVPPLMLGEGGDGEEEVIQALAKVRALEAQIAALQLRVADSVLGEGGVGGDGEVVQTLVTSPADPGDVERGFEFD
jgi:hypothetical protein